MAEYAFAHLGVNAENAEEARKAAELFHLMFGLPVRAGNGSFYAGDEIEIMSGSGRGACGHIAIATPDVAAAQAELEERGFAFDPSSKKYKDGRLNVIYFKDEFCGFAVHLVGSKKQR